MRPTIDFMDHKRMPCFLPESERLVTYLKTKKQEELKEQIKDLTGETPEGAIKHYCHNKAAAETLSEYVEAQRVSKQLLLTQEKEKGPQR